MTFRVDGATLRDAMAAIQAGSGSVALGIDREGRLTGLVTDGDVRRALLAGLELRDAVDSALRRDFITVRPDWSRTDVLDLMRATGIAQIPVVSDDGRLVGVHLLKEFLGRIPRSNACLILAGGRGTRLLPPTSEIPKPMVPVAGRPILERLVTHLVGFGLQNIYLSVGHRAEVIENHFADGSAFGCHISYLKEDPSQPLGTAGPLALLQQIAGPLEQPVIVLNGDLVTQFDVSDMLDHHAASGAALTVGSHLYTHEVPFGVLEVDDAGFLSAISEKPLRTDVVSAGIYVIDPAVLSHVPAGRQVLMTEVIAGCLDRGDKVHTWACDSEWVDIGRPHDLARARGGI